MLRIDDLPLDQYNQGFEKQTPAKKIPYKQHRCEHHKMSPVKNTAVDAAPVLHDQRLEWTVDQNTDVVAKEIKYSQHQ